jgi:hypothetical protein
MIGIKKTSKQECLAAFHSRAILKQSASASHSRYSPTIREERLGAHIAQ